MRKERKRKIHFLKPCSSCSGTKQKQVRWMGLLVVPEGDPKTRCSQVSWERCLNRSEEWCWHGVVPRQVTRLILCHKLFFVDFDKMPSATLWYKDLPDCIVSVLKPVIHRRTAPHLFTFQKRQARVFSSPLHLKYVISLLALVKFQGTVTLLFGIWSSSRRD